MHFFDISTSKSGPSMVCFSHFDLDMCFAPQRRALFRHHNFQKWSDVGVLCRFWLRKAATVCNVSSLIWPAGSAPAALASLRSHKMPQIIGKTHCFATFLSFRAPGSSFFCLFVFSDLLSSALLFSILLLHLCFSSVHIVGSLTSKHSKLPSIIYTYLYHIHMFYNIHMIYILFIYLFMYLFSYLFIYLILYIYMCIYIYIYTCVYVHIYIFIYTYLHIYIYIYICIYINVYIYIYITYNHKIIFLFLDTVSCYVISCNIRSIPFCS